MPKNKDCCDGSKSNWRMYPLRISFGALVHDSNINSHHQVDVTILDKGWTPTQIATVAAVTVRLASTGRATVQMFFYRNTHLLQHRWFDDWLLGCTVQES